MYCSSSLIFHFWRIFTFLSSVSILYSAHCWNSVLTVKQSGIQFVWNEMVLRYSYIWSPRQNFDAALATSTQLKSCHYLLGLCDVYRLVSLLNCCSLLDGIGQAFSSVSVPSGSWPLGHCSISSSGLLVVCVLDRRFWAVFSMLHVYALADNWGGCWGSLLMCCGKSNMKWTCFSHSKKIRAQHFYSSPGCKNTPVCFMQKVLCAIILEYTGQHFEI